MKHVLQLIGVSDPRDQIHLSEARQDIRAPSADFQRRRKDANDKVSMRHYRPWSLPTIYSMTPLQKRLRSNMIPVQSWPGFHYEVVGYPCCKETDFSPRFTTAYSARNSRILPIPRKEPKAIDTSPFEIIISLLESFVQSCVV